MAFEISRIQAVRVKRAEASTTRSERRPTARTATLRACVGPAMGPGRPTYERPLSAWACPLTAVTRTVTGRAPCRDEARERGPARVRVGDWPPGGGDRCGQRSNRHWGLRNSHPSVMHSAIGCWDWVMVTGRSGGGDPPPTTPPETTSPPFFFFSPPPPLPTCPRAPRLLCQHLYELGKLGAAP